jgi:hypothetical protein
LASLLADVGGRVVMLRLIGGSGQAASARTQVGAGDVSLVASMLALGNPFRRNG